ncbi:hypothetical protein [Leptospira adleri]|uniref:DUF1554 domain-containing protein n=1 Tax=Leptospira adleri TaxID=2023186 RepID=A0A2M9YPC4_9LEPT|nr:hypothetical protein [Leptospira adleri]PJZ53340.1 hypothetical protein CH380_11090 [Leptospira adleri]PJZ63851.1 hypothetical protein CH376_00015 [Leptospira adleri]
MIKKIRISFTSSVLSKVLLLNLSSLLLFSPMISCKKVSDAASYALFGISEQLINLLNTPTGLPISLPAGLVAGCPSGTSTSILTIGNCFDDGKDKSISGFIVTKSGGSSCSAPEIYSPTIALNSLLSSLANDSTSAESPPPSPSFASYSLINLGSVSSGAQSARFILQTDQQRTTEWVRNEIQKKIFNDGSQNIGTTSGASTDTSFIVTIRATATGNSCTATVDTKYEVTVVRAGAWDLYSSLVDGNLGGGGSSPPDLRNVSCTWRETLPTKAPPKADFLFVIDNSDTMTPIQTAIKSKMVAFFDRVSTVGLNARIAVITTDSWKLQSPSGDNGNWLDVSSSTDRTTFTDTLNAIGNNGGQFESGIFMATRALMNSSSGGTSCTGVQPYCSSSGRTTNGDKCSITSVASEDPCNATNQNAWSKKVGLGRSSVPTAVIIITDEGDMYNHWDSFNATFGAKMTPWGPLDSPPDVFPTQRSVTFPTSPLYYNAGSAGTPVLGSGRTYTDFLDSLRNTSTGVTGTPSINAILNLFADRANTKVYGIIALNSQNNDYTTIDTAKSIDPSAYSSSTLTNFHTKTEVFCKGEITSSTQWATSGQVAHYRTLANIGNTSLTNQLLNTPNNLGRDDMVYSLKDIATTSGGGVTSLCGTSNSISNYLNSIVDSMVALQGGYPVGKYDAVWNRTVTSGNPNTALFPTGTAPTTGNISPGSVKLYAISDTRNIDGTDFITANLVPTGTQTATNATGFSYTMINGNLVFTKYSGFTNLPAGASVNRILGLEYKYTWKDTTAAGNTNTTVGNAANCPAYPIASSDTASPLTPISRRIFVSASTHNGNFGADANAAVTAADAFCNADGNKPSTGTYKALLWVGTVRNPATTDWPLKSKVAYFQSGDNRTWVGTTDVNKKFPFPLVSGNGNAADGVWTGIDIAGTGPWTWSEDTNTCNGFTSTAGTGSTGTANASTVSGFDDNTGDNCNNAKKIYCVEQ